MPRPMLGTSPTGLMIAEPMRVREALVTEGHPESFPHALGHAFAELAARGQMPGVPVPKLTQPVCDGQACCWK